jgi:predicted permease
LVPLVPKLAANILPLENNQASGVSLAVLGFTIGLSLLTGLFMGLYPAWQSSRSDLVDALKEGGRSASGSVKQQRFRKILVGAQVALSITLLAGASLLIASFVRLSHQEPGFRSDHLWIGFVTFPLSTYPDIASRERFVERVTEALRNTPGLEAASISGDFPLAGGNNATLYARADRELLPIPQRAAGASHDISPGYFKLWGIPILAGRDLDQHDVDGGQHVMLISQTGANKVFPGENPIGKTVLVTSLAVPCEIIGIVGDVRSDKLSKVENMEFYRPWAQENFPFMTVEVRSQLPLDAVTKSVQGVINGIDAGIAIAQPQSFDTIMAQALGQARLMMTLLGIFAGVALLLATVGIYGAVAYTVEQRTGEIGVRMALGAQTADVLRLVVGQGMRPVFVGLVLGLAAAVAVGKLISTQLYQVSPYSPMLLLMTTIVLGTAALLACLFPARKATQLNPVTALRFE